ncbi:hypothetical protein ZMO1_ZMO2067 [Zymomonas mobilis subsp. mobilis ZM4 = ATCC 31821]|nr:hypothetical protein B9T50_08520 [Zymomonas mobilis subsp. mobilis]QIZ64076.1 hypothetical protein ZMO1_ZMO2067 [Zymomonas mobilis subsp. mobilis ZM4 = ATCC 31821]HCE37936.1 hypothetical protein [Zymomonas mobilis]
MLRYNICNSSLIKPVARLGQFWIDPALSCLELMRPFMTTAGKILKQASSAALGLGYVSTSGSDSRFTFFKVSRSFFPFLEVGYVL